MTEDEGRAWVRARFGEDAVTALERFVVLLREEAPRQNLVSASSIATVWVRHIVDSAQLVALATQAGRWIDIGTGAGFPGLVTALLSGRETTLVEPRRRRVEFLQRAIYELDLGSQIVVRQARAEAIMDRSDVISARAVSSIDTLLNNAAKCGDQATQWLFPKGRHAREEVAHAEKSWHGMFHVEQSVTDPESMIVIASGISRR